MNNLYFDPGLYLREILIVGLGGTGSQLARSICRMIFDMRSRGLQIPSVRFIDPDIVEMKNVGRQMFTVADVGQHKAEVLAKRFNAALGLDISWHNESFSKAMIAHHSTPLICGAVDNHHARKSIAEVHRACWIDAGNHFDSGQVVIGNTDSIDTAMTSLQRPDKNGCIQHLPNAALLFPASLEPEPVPDMPAVSCADLVAFGEQHVLINDWIAGVAANYVYKLLHRQKIETFATFIDIGMMNVRSKRIDREEIESYLLRVN